MIGMILCGGFGKRLRSVSENLPKLLLEIKRNYTLLDRQIFQYRSAGIEKVILLTGYQGELIKRHLRKQRFGVSLEYVKEKKPLGTLNAIRLGMKRAKGDVVVSNGDIVCDINLKRMCDEWCQSKAWGSMFVVQMRSPYGIVHIKNKKILGFEEKPLLNQYINGGFYCLSKRVLPILEKYKTGDIEKTAFPELAKKGKFASYQEDGIYWISIDSPKDLEAVRKEYENRADKPWGYEKLLRLNQKSMEKLLYLMSGCRTSMHYHEKRDEILKVVRGSGWVEYEKGTRKRLKPGKSVHVHPGEVHSFVAESNLLLYEKSTPHPTDVIRVKDFYGFRLGAY